MYQTATLQKHTPNNTQHLSCSEKHKNIVFQNVCCVMMLYVFCVVLCVSFCTGHFFMVPLNMTYLHCLQHSLFEHLLHLYYSLKT